MGMPSGIGIVDSMIGVDEIPQRALRTMWPKFLSGNARRILKFG
jgi:hypothetical protein